MAEKKLYVRRGGWVPGDVVEIAGRTEDKVDFFPIGGGFERQMPAEAFDIAHRSIDPSDLHSLEPHDAVYDIDGMFGDVSGYSFGLNWNGWACPLFPKESCDRIVSVVGNGARYDDAEGAYVIPRDDSSDQPGSFETYRSRIIRVSGKPVQVWPIGNGSWMWEEGRQGSSE